MTNLNSKRFATAVGKLMIVSTLAWGLAACSKNTEEKTVGQQLDQAIASTEKKAEQAGKDMNKGVDIAKKEVKEATAEVKEMAGDAGITASINAELAKDSELSALRINVDTLDGKVSLKGQAPNDKAKDRAASLAAGVKGVRNVENNLVVKAG